MKLLSLAALAISLLSSGCATTTHVFVKSTQKTNGGNTLYMMVRNVEGKTSVNEQYQEMAAKLFAEPADRSVIVAQPIFPGNTVDVTISEADVTQVVLYFFFSQPLSNWRVPLPKPLPAEGYIDLGENEIDRVQIRKR